MALVAPVNLPYNIKTLWFDPEGLELHANDEVVVQTARGLELGVMAGDPFDVPYEDVKKLKSPLRPVKRVATEEDLQRAEEMEQKARDAMPLFKQLAREHNEDMHPVSVEFMLDGDKAVFYFESEERIDFRDLVRKLAAEFHVRIDMRQIGVRDEARIVGGIAHCGQLVCCKRLGGEFKPVSIRMAKDQDLSLNPQKISGLCGRLMCCLRYENDIYKEFKKTAPKVGASVSTPEGEGRVVEYDVPRDTVSIKVGDDKPVKIPASDIQDISEDRKSASVSDEAWESAVEEAKVSIFGGSDLFATPSFTGEDKLGDAKAVHHEQSKKEKPARSGKRTGRGRGKGGNSGTSGNSGGESAEPKRSPRRRSTTIKAEGGKTTVEGEGRQGKGKQAQGSQKASGSKGSGQKQQKGQGKASSQKGSAKKSGQKLRPGHKSSGLSHDDGQGQGGKQRGQGQGGQGGRGQNGSGGQGQQGDGKGSSSGNRRRRRRRSSGKGAGGGQGNSGTASGSSAKQGE